MWCSTYEHAMLLPLLLLLDSHQPPMAVLTGLGSFSRCKDQFRCASSSDAPWPPGYNSHCWPACIPSYCSSCCPHSCHPSCHPSCCSSRRPSSYCGCQDCSTAPLPLTCDLGLWCSCSPSSRCQCNAGPSMQTIACCCEANRWPHIFCGAPAARFTHLQLLRHSHTGWSLA